MKTDSIKEIKTVDVIINLIRPYLDGTCYETQNPYTRPYVKEGLLFLQKHYFPEIEDWLDINKKIISRENNNA